MIWIIAAMIGTFVLWKVSGFLADHPPKIELQVSLPIVEWETPQETAEDRYHKLLAKIDKLPLKKLERKLAREVARQKYISES